MLQSHRDALDRNLVSFERYLDYESLLPYLHDGKILTDFHVEQLEQESTPSSRRIHFIGMIKRRGPKAFRALCEALQRTGQYQLIDCLRKTLGEENFFPEIETLRKASSENDDEQLPVSPSSGVVTNEIFYEHLLEQCKVVEATDGILDVKVIAAASLPERYNEKEVRVLVLALHYCILILAMIKFAREVSGNSLPEQVMIVR
ncbi:unnamed protein product [Soboliphyme baturini]|uniref:CARD domain-containing protein n=1 Tax=Soboliphyme baturini TaxID=241478 RepID=A0A183I9J5_9BILA|nr:unnamed protein product [Soboliphyme baturini]